VNALPGAHRREYRGLLTAGERRALRWLALRVPDSISPDHLTALGFAGMMVAAAGFAAARLDGRWLALVVVGLAVNWLGDSLDGTLARVRGCERPCYGYYVDHVLDVAGTVALLVGLACSGLVTPVLGLAFLVAFLAVESERFLATHSTGVFRMSFLGIGPTELRLLLAAGVGVAARRPAVHLGSHGPYLLFDVGAAIGVAALAVVFVAGAYANGRALYRAEPLPGRRAPYRREGSSRPAAPEEVPCAKRI